MSKFPSPLASSLAIVEFSRLTADEVRRISVKRIHVAPTFDSLGGPVPGGLYDPALGAVKALDTTCTTCQMNSERCSGHPGHIDLPVPCYHVSFIDQTLRLLRAKCVYCHRLRMSRPMIDLVICKLRLLQYGLLDELRILERMHLRTNEKPAGRSQGEELANGVGSDIGEEEDLEDFMERRRNYVNRVINRARKKTREDRLTLLRNPAAVEERKLVATDFLREIAKTKKCSHCQGISPSYRKDRNSKMFEKPLSKKYRDQMKMAGLVAAKPLLILAEEAKQKRQLERPIVNGYNKDDLEMTDAAENEKEALHGAEEEITLNNAREAASQDEIAESEEEPVQRYLTSNDVHAALELLFRNEQEILSLIYNSRPNRKAPAVSADMFFIMRVLVPPSKFRPAAKQGNTYTEAAQNGIFNRIIKACGDIDQISHEIRHPQIDVPRKRGLHDLENTGVALQECVNALIDQVPNPALGRQNEDGIKQTLEKKEGLFRMNMMGKRVNFAARSVISPDPNIETNEIGVPLVFAKKLTYTEPVTSHNFMELKQLVINGPNKYPGAMAVEDENGQVTRLKSKSVEQRLALANQLLTPTNPGIKGSRNKKVDRHLRTGDVVIMNRQPTLHKPSMMGHRARVLQNEKTIRMHYANCNTYNADFDGDEMNMHFPQNELARSEAYQIADTDHQYLSATAGKPLRGLIQDHISMGVQFSSRDTFFDRDGYQQLLYNCLRPENGHTTSDKIELVEPAILKPKPMWTGKQVITTVLKNITPSSREGLNLISKSSTSADHWFEKSESDPAKFKVGKQYVNHRDTEQNVIFKDGEHLCGILDKSQMGPSVGGLIHSVHELYGHIVAGKLLSLLGRLLTRFLAERAWTCGVDDLYLTPEGDNTRRELLTGSKRIGQEVAAKYVSLNPDDLEDRDSRLLSGLEGVLRDDDQQTGLDQAYNARTSTLTGNITKTCLPSSLRKPFPRNQMQAMTTSGAKGSNVNASLISCNLGQQVLEGKRVPTMVSGKTLPAFRAYETDPGAGGYVSGRFLTGINPKEYYFHAMSGREGLIDTAVKTSKSGYLQRCIVKGLEGLKTEYDTSVRESSNGSVVQFLYGEDGLDITKQKHLRDFSFLGQNIRSVVAATNAMEDLKRFYKKELDDLQKVTLKAVKKDQAQKLDPVMALHFPTDNLGSTSESFARSLAAYIKENPDQVIRGKKTETEGVSKKTFQGTMEFKYMKSLVEAGEAVGVVAAQSVGEPSTQMTLNTFHLAGHSAKNVTLGIPRLREILMTASANISTPMMTLKPIPEIPTDDGVRFAKSISKLSLADLIQGLSVQERSDAKNGTTRDYRIEIELWPAAEYIEEHAIQIADVDKTLKTRFIKTLEKFIAAEMKKKAKESALSETTAAVPAIGVSVGRERSPARETRGTEEDPDREGGQDDREEDDDDVDNEDAKQTATKDHQGAKYDDPDDDELLAAEASERDWFSDDEDEPSEHKRGRKARKAPNLREQTPDDSETMDSEEEAIHRDEEETLKSSHPHLSRFKFNQKLGQTCKIQLSYNSNTPKLLLLPIVEKAVHTSIIQSIPGLTNCVLTTEKVQDQATGAAMRNPETGEEITENIITTAGVNLLAMRDYQDIINPHTLYTNSVHDMLNLYGVEAARATIVKEIDSVFKGHGISVDMRHLLLIGDAMTQSGGYKAFSRNGIVKESGSVLAKMSFETVMGFLKEAVLEGEGDNLMGPSARIVVGRRGGVGTGAFDVVVPVGSGSGVVV